MEYKVEFLVSKDNINWSNKQSHIYYLPSEMLSRKKIIKRLEKLVKRNIDDNLVFVKFLSYTKL